MVSREFNELHRALRIATDCYRSLSRKAFRRCRRNSSQPIGFGGGHKTGHTRNRSKKPRTPHPVNIFVSLRGQFFGNFGTQPLNERYSDVSPLANRPDAQFTVNVPLLPVPPIVVTAIGPVMAPVGTLVVIFVAEFTVNVVALTPPNVTFDAPVKPVPIIVTGVPTEPDVGLNEVSAGGTLKLVCVLSLPLG